MRLWPLDIGSRFLGPAGPKGRGAGARETGSSEASENRVSKGGRQILQVIRGQR